MSKTNVFAAAGWMVVITLALFFLPLINGLVGGAVGGYKAGTWGRALLAAIIPAAVVGILLWMFMLAVELPVIGALAGLTAGALVVLADLGILIGAVAGGLLAQHRRPQLAQ